MTTLQNKTSENEGKKEVNLQLTHGTVVYNHLIISNNLHQHVIIILDDRAIVYRFTIDCAIYFVFTLIRSWVQKTTTSFTTLFTFFFCYFTSFYQSLDLCSDDA